MFLLEKLILKYQRLRFRLLFPEKWKDGLVYGVFSIIHPENFQFGRGLTLNDFCYINASYPITIGDNVSISAGAKIISVKLNFSDHGLQEGKLYHVGNAITIGNNVQIGAGAIILPGVTIVDNVIIGAGAVVSRSVSESGIYVGIPAARIS